MTVTLDGKALKEKLLQQLKVKVDGFDKKPGLSVILVGDNPASILYVNNKKKTAEKLGIHSEIIHYDIDTPQEVIINKINELNNNDNVNAILVQLPLPPHIDKFKIIDAINPQKDVDGFTFYNSGKLFSGEEPFVYPCTPKGILLLLKEYNITLEGKHVVIVGRSNIAGKPLAMMMLNNNATVTLCHSYTKNLEQITKTADILISATGHDIIKKGMVKKGSVVIDVGIFKDENGKTRGDVDFSDVYPDISYISPVPGGVGPMTIISLMLNTVELYEKSLNNK